MSDFNIEFEENDQQIKLEFESGVGGTVSSVNGMTGDVVLDAEDVGAYVKPSGGIPKTDLASAVQTSLGKADSAYQKPSGGIPASDIASGVVPAVDNTLTVSGAAADAKKTGDEIATVKDGLDAVTDQINATLITDTASGSIASFPDGANDILVKSLTVDIEPVQSGSGDPSPTNIRPISGHTSAVVTVSPTTDAQDGTSYTIDLDGTRYGGTLNVTTGVLTVDMAIATLSSDDINTLTVEDTAGGKKRLMIPKTFFSGILLGNPSGTVANISCNQFVAKTANQTYSRSIGISLNAAGQIHIYGGDDIQTVSAFANIAPIQIVYPLATPFTVQLTAQDDITTVLGQNNIWNDCGDTTVEYRADTKLYINKVLNA